MQFRTNEETLLKKTTQLRAENWSGANENSFMMWFVYLRGDKIFSLTDGGFLHALHRRARMWELHGLNFFSNSNSTLYLKNRKQKILKRWSRKVFFTLVAKRREQRVSCSDSSLGEMFTNIKLVRKKIHD